MSSKIPAVCTWLSLILLLQESILSRTHRSTQLTTTSLTTTHTPSPTLFSCKLSPPVSQKDDTPPAGEEHMGDINTNIRVIIAGLAEEEEEKEEEEE